MHESGKPNPCQDKFATTKVQGQMCLRCMSQENPTCAKINLLRKRHKAKYA
ncbi:hypothetical protein BHE74_00010950 [Ensete ventricosum]|nr:hypothetical protein BHE74_00010950 [Ensete ventricosum]RZR85591.1 hypothetical protein BHM03_00012608 [Ensete ventricosum]